MDEHVSFTFFSFLFKSYNIFISYIAILPQWLMSIVTSRNGYFTSGNASNLLF